MLCFLRRREREREKRAYKNEEGVNPKEERERPCDFYCFTDDDRCLSGPIEEIE